MTASHEVRAGIAREAFAALGPNPSEQLVLMVQCDSAHHLATVHDTTAGRVFHSVLHARSHGRKDRPDVGHHGAQLGRDWYDLLDVEDASANDDLPAGCECGPYTLSREGLIRQIADGETRVIVSRPGSCGAQSPSVASAWQGRKSPHLPPAVLTPRLGTDLLPAALRRQPARHSAAGGW